MISIRVYVKKKVELSRLDADQQSMFRLGTVALAARKNDIRAALNSRGAAAKPLKKGYAIRKTRLGKGNRRNLSFSGDMMREWSVRTVSTNRAKMTWTTRRNREKARANNRVEEFVSFSPKNERDIVVVAEQILIREKLGRIAFQRVLHAN